MASRKFEVIIKTVTKKRYEVEAKDAEFAKTKAMGARYYEGEVVSKDTVVTSVKQTSPRYVSEQVEYGRYFVTDTKTNDLVAEVYYLDVAEMMVAAMNAEEEEAK